jgi:hypothetical protein
MQMYFVASNIICRILVLFYFFFFAITVLMVTREKPTLQWCHLALGIICKPRPTDSQIFFFHAFFLLLFFLFWQ